MTIKPCSFLSEPQMNPYQQIDAEYKRTIVVGVEISQDSDGIPIWFTQTKLSKPICIGHLRYRRVELVPRRLYALDTNCCKGGQLTALILPERRLVSVGAKLNYYLNSKQIWGLRGSGAIRKK